VKEHPLLHRYVAGQRLYFKTCRPWLRASVIVDNIDWDHPRFRPASDGAEKQE